jgi:serine/threonine-protein phosphatase 2A regulatory subunit B'
LLLQTPPGLGRRALLLKKLRLCSHWLDLGPAGAARHLSLPPREREAEARARETKRLALLELVNYFSVAKPLWAADEMAAVFDMLAHNLFRPLPPSSFETQRWAGSVVGGAGGGAGHFTFAPEEDPQREDDNWPHVQIAYELLLRMLAPPPAHGPEPAANNEKDNPHPEPVATAQQRQTAHKLLYSTFLSRRFLLSLLNNFGSEDSRERDYLKTILHRVYGQSMALRPFIRRSVQSVLCAVIYEDERKHGQTGADGQRADGVRGDGRWESAGGGNGKRRAVLAHSSLG